MHLAELNISNWKINPASKGAAGFVNNVGRINSLAARSPGFVWRKVEEERDANGFNALGGPRTLMTMSVWENPKYLEEFVWNTVHKKIYQNKAQWFDQLESHHLVMWWVEEGVEPSILDAKPRLDHLNSHGDSDHAFGWSHLPHVKLWQQQRCA